MKRQRTGRKRFIAFLTATLAGGTLFGTCETRVHDALIDGSKNFIYQLLDPSGLINQLNSNSQTNSG